jgi:hypothetical protein
LIRWSIILFLFLLPSLVIADEMTGIVDQPTTISTACIRNGQLRENATATITIFQTNGSTLVPKTSMNPAGNGTFSYTYTFTQTGGYNTRETCTFAPIFGGTDSILADGSTLVTINKPAFGNMQVISQAVTNSNINKTIKAEWILLLPNSTNTSQSSISVNGAVCSVSNVNGSTINLTLTPSVTNDLLTTTFQTDPSHGFIEGENYQVACDISLTQGMSVKGVKTFFYINPQGSWLSFFTNILSSIGQLLGIAQSTSNTVNQTYDITNQTLAIVTALNNSASVQEANMQALS